MENHSTNPLISVLPSSIFVKTLQKTVLAHPIVHLYFSVISSEGPVEEEIGPPL